VLCWNYRLCYTTFKFEVSIVLFAGALTTVLAVQQNPNSQEESGSQFVEGVQRMSQEHKDSVHLLQYTRDSAILAVYVSNHHEGTLPQGFTEAETYLLLEESWDSADCASLQKPSEQIWHEEGGKNVAEGTAQLLQHMKALKFLCFERVSEQMRLTPEILKETHKILMDGAVTIEGAKLLTGYRSQGAYTDTGHVYMRPPFIAAAVTDYVEQYNTAAAAGVDPVKMAADLFYGLIHLVHPFQKAMVGLAVCWCLMC